MSFDQNLFAKLSTDNQKFIMLLSSQNKNSQEWKKNADQTGCASV